MWYLSPSEIRRESVLSDPASADSARDAAEPRGGDSDDPRNAAAARSGARPKASAVPGSEYWLP